MVREGRTKNDQTNVHVNEFLANDASLVVQGVELPPIPSVVVVVWPILQRDEEMEPGLPHCPVPHDVSPQLRFWRPQPIRMQNWDVWDGESHGRST